MRYSSLSPCFQARGIDGAYEIAEQAPLSGLDIGGRSHPRLQGHHGIPAIDGGTQKRYPGDIHEALLLIIDRVRADAPDAARNRAIARKGKGLELQRDLLRVFCFPR